MKGLVEVTTYVASYITDKSKVLKVAKNQF